MTENQNQNQNQNPLEMLGMYYAEMRKLVGQYGKCSVDDRSLSFMEGMKAKTAEYVIELETGANESAARIARLEAALACAEAEREEARAQAEDLRGRAQAVEAELEKYPVGAELCSVAILALNEIDEVMGRVGRANVGLDADAPQDGAPPAAPEQGQTAPTVPESMAEDAVAPAPPLEAFTTEPFAPVPAVGGEDADMPLAADAEDGSASMQAPAGVAGDGGFFDVEMIGIEPVGVEPDDGEGGDAPARPELDEMLAKLMHDGESIAGGENPVG